MCHVDDSVRLGAWLQETDHKDIEDQVLYYSLLFLVIGCLGLLSAVHCGQR